MFDKSYRVNDNYNSLFLKENSKILVLDVLNGIAQTF
jgi:hypothetical protein